MPIILDCTSVHVQILKWCGNEDLNARQTNESPNLFSSHTTYMYMYYIIYILEPIRTSKNCLMLRRLLSDTHN